MIIVLIALFFGVFYLMNNKTTTTKATTATAAKKTTTTTTAAKSSNNELTDSNSFFNRALKAVFGSEGGYSNNPKDKGGATNMGITQGTYNSWNLAHFKATKPVIQITKQEATDIYYNWYWKTLNLDKATNYNMALVLFDTGVQFGVGTAGNILRHTGYNIKAYLEYRWKVYKQDSTFATFGAGWKNRLNRLNAMTGAGATFA